MTSSMTDSIQSSLSASQLQNNKVNVDNVVQTIHWLLEHLKYACLAIGDSLASFLTACLWHIFSPWCVIACALIPIPKGSKDTSCSKHCWPIALASTLNKGMEHIKICVVVNCSLVSRLVHLPQPVLSWSKWLCLATSTIMSSKVYGCYLDASEAFDRVESESWFAFQKLVKKGLPSLVTDFLLHWYTKEESSVEPRLSVQ